MPQRVRKPSFSTSLYKLRNAAETFFYKIKHCCAIATRFKTHPKNYPGLIKLQGLGLTLDRAHIGERVGCEHIFLPADQIR
jgi:transposase